MDDAIRGDARAAVQKLRFLGIHPVLLTGDKGPAAERAAAAAGIQEIHSGLMPEGKAAQVLEASWGSGSHPPKGMLEEGLLGSDRRGPVNVGFVGDGLNDCTALASAHIGIVMQELGTQ